MSSTQVNQRDLYLLTRSEATALVAMYMNAKKKGADGSIEPERVFRDELETAKPAYLGRFNNSHNSAVQGSFYKIALNLYKILEELNYRVSETNHHEKTMDAAKLLPCKHSIAYLSAYFLNWAIYNWYMKTEPVVEDLGDNGYEFNTCAVCNDTGHYLFYFSTAYGLDNPICENCLPVDDNDYEEEGEYEEEEEEGEYEEGEYEEEEDLTKLSGQQLRDIWCVLIGKPTGIACSGKLRTKKMLIDEIIRLRESTEAEAEEEEEAEASDDDEDYEPSNESEAEQEEDDIDDEINSEEEDESEEDADEDEKYFGCTGCPYEWRAGFKHGYKTAMKEMRNYANKQKHNIPEAPVCDVCGDSHENLKKCGKCRAVRYCSEECQTEDWAQHKHVCRKE
jgi:hypothetical protein